MRMCLRGSSLPTSYRLRRWCLHAVAVFAYSIAAVHASALTLTDTLDSWRMTGGASHGVVLDNQNASLFFGDNSRAKCDGTTVGSFFYHLQNINSFSAIVYYYQAAGQVEVYTSPDNVTWTPLRVRQDTPQPTTNRAGDGWTYSKIVPDGAVPEGTNYIGFTLRSNELMFTPQIGQVTIDYGDVVVAKPGPRGLSVVPADGRTLLTWYPLDGADNYDLMRRPATSSEFKVIARGVASTNYMDQGLANGVKYYYAVTASTKAGRTDKSDEVLSVPAAGKSVVFDGLTDWTVASAHSSNLTFGTNSAGGDILKRTSNTRETVTYQVPGVSTFAFNIYGAEADLSPQISAECSPDGVDWKPVSLVFDLPAKLSTHAFASVCSPESALPKGTKFVRLTLGADGLPAGSPEIADVRFTETASDAAP